VQPQDLVITLLGCYVRSPGATVWSGGLVELLGEFGFSEGAARVALTRLVRRGLLERVRAGRLVHYRVTPRCERLLAEGDGRIFGLGHARGAGDGWTLLLHQIPETRRLELSRLSRRLRFLGFGAIPDGTWVSPHDHREEVTRLLVDLGVEDFATVFVAQPGAGVSGLVARAWDLSGLADRYDAFCAAFGDLVVAGDLQAFLVRTRATHIFRAFPSLDPELPEELAPLGHARERAVGIFEGLYAGLRDGAQRHFDAVTRLPAPLSVAS
jgi:phenylacetic acid degradation operon negative regulatory protein